MRIDKFLMSLLPSFKKDSLRDELTNVRNMLNETVIPPYASATPVLAKVKFDSAAIQKFEKAFAANVKTEFKGNYVVVINAAMKRLQENLPVVEKFVEKSFVDDVFRDAMTFLRANLIQYIEVMGFATKYARKLLIWTLYEASSEEDKRAGLVGEGLSKAEQRWLQEKSVSFFQAINMLAVSHQALEKSFKEMPEATVTGDNIAMIESTVGMQRTDPFKMGFIPTSLNPFFYIGKKIAEYQVSTYNAAVEEKKALEIRLLNYKQAQEGGSDPKLQQAIEYSEDRLQKLNYKIAQMEEDYLGDAKKDY